MTLQFAIVAFPDLSLAERIEAVRRRFDPLALMLPAHITLVFPFADQSIAPQLTSHATRAAAEVAAFEISLTGPIAVDSEYLCLNVVTGVGPLMRLHDRLYSGLLKPHRSSVHVYHPHVTVGRVAPDQLSDAACAARTALQGPFVGRITELAVFRLDGPTHGVVQHAIPLAAS